MIRKGDKRAFHKFFNAYYDQLLRFLSARGMSLAVAQDLIQNAFIYIWEHREQIEADKSLRSYLYRIAYTRMLNHIKSQKKFDSEVSPGEQGHSLENPEEELRGKELMDVVQTAVDNMPDKRKAVFELCFMQEFTYRETAEMMKISKNTVENHMTKAFKDVRSAVNVFYEINPDHTSGQPGG